MHPSLSLVLLVIKVLIDYNTKYESLSYKFVFKYFFQFKCFLCIRPLQIDCQKTPDNHPFYSQEVHEHLPCPGHDLA